MTENSDSDKILHQQILDKISKLTYKQMQDIAALAVAEGAKRLYVKQRRKNENNPMQFTGYWDENDNGTKLFWMRNKYDDEGVVTFSIKGGDHELLNQRMSPYDKRKFILIAARALGYSVHKTKKRGWEIYIPKTQRKSSTK